jgi:hypothetical protein
MPVRWLRLLMALVLAVASVKLLGESMRLATPAKARSANGTSDR